MNEKQYRWPDLSAIERQYVVVDDQGRYGIATQDHRKDVLFAHPINVPSVIPADKLGIKNMPAKATLMTPTAWNLHPDGSYTGTWYDYDGPTFPATVPEEMIRRLTIVEDLGYKIPDRWAEIALEGSQEMSHWDYGATLGKVGGFPPVKGQLPGEMTVKAAENYAHEVGESVTARAIRHAAENGYIPGARKIGRDWLIPYEGFNHYLENRPRPGRK